MTDGTRSNLWGSMRAAIETIQPRYVVAENVRGLLSARAASDSDLEPGDGSVGGGSADNLRALGRVLGDLADIGYDAQWHSLRASDVGAPHGRFRVFILAERRAGDAPDGGRDHESNARRSNRPARATGGPDRASSHAMRGRGGGRGNVTSPGESRESHLTPIWSDDRPGSAGATTADAEGIRPGDDLQSRVTGIQTTAGPSSSGTIDWGPYAPAIRRAEAVLGRRAPAPTELTAKGRHRLSALFAEWMMLLPEGWVTGVPGISRADQLKMLGNGVVPLQAITALQVMRARATEAGL